MQGFNLRKKRVESLDFLKFVSATIIIFHHFQMRFQYENRIIDFSNGPIRYGLIVELFFMISGMLTELNYDKYRQQGLGEFVKGRILRLYPMMIMACLFFCLCDFIYLKETGTWFEDWRTQRSLYIVIASMTGIFKGGAIGDVAWGCNNPTWYISVLIVCYIFYRLILSAEKRFYVNRIYFYVAMVFLGLSIRTYVINLPFMNLDISRGYYSYFGGILFLHLYEWMKHWLSSKCRIVFSLLVIVMFVWCGLYHPAFILDHDWFNFTFLLFPSILLFTETLFETCRLRCNKILGAISYEMYLWHLPFIVLIKLFEKREFIVPSNDGYMLLFWGGVIVWGCIIYKFVEIPLNKIILLCLGNKTK